MKITINKFKSKNSVANFNLDFENGLTLSFVELIIVQKEGKELKFLSHKTTKKQEDGSYKDTYHSYMTKEFQEKILPEIETQLKNLQNEPKTEEQPVVAF